MPQRLRRGSGSVAQRWVTLRQLTLMDSERDAEGWSQMADLTRPARGSAASAPGPRTQRFRTYADGLRATDPATKTWNFSACWPEVRSRRLKALEDPGGNGSGWSRHTYIEDAAGQLRTADG